MKWARADEMDDTQSTDEKPTILIIDGDDACVELHSVILATIGCQPIGCSSDAQEAIRLARTERPDAIITDPLNAEWGVDVCWEIQSHPATNKIPFIFASNLGCAGTDVQLAGLEFAEYISKPFHAQQLREAVQRVLETPPESMPRLKVEVVPLEIRVGSSRRPKVLKAWRKRKLVWNRSTQMVSRITNAQHK
jgi:response regulator RpfG family c-di-GMP phosphodiesterase